MFLAAGYYCEMEYVSICAPITTNNNNSNNNNIMYPPPLVCVGPGNDITPNKSHQLFGGCCAYLFTATAATNHCYHRIGIKFKRNPNEFEDTIKH